MPKETFFNLPEEKRNRIIETAIDEFYEHSYHKASINRIVEGADIAKGSFYQYFQDKKDLFKYIIEKSGEEKLSFINKEVANLNSGNFFEVVRAMYIAGIKFSQNHPKLSKITIDFLKNNDTKLKEEILGDSTQKGTKFFEDLLKKGIEGGSIDPNIDIGLVAFMITSLSVSISEYFIKEVRAEDEMEIMNLIDKMLYVIKNGIQNRRDG